MEIRNAVIFNGYDLRDYGLYVSGNKTFDSPTKEVTRVSIPGRSGDLISFTGRYTNVELTYDSILIKDYYKNAAAIRSILMSSEGYCRLEDSYHKDEYRMAHFMGPINFESVYLEAGQTTLSFDCQPQRWLKEGEKEIVITSGAAGTYTFLVYNPTLFESKPLFKIESAGKVTISSRQVATELAAKSYIEATYTSDTATHFIDCETMNAYGMTGDVKSNENSVVEVNDVVVGGDDTSSDVFPTLKPGTNEITVVAAASAVVSMTPRWYIL